MRRRIHAEEDTCMSDEEVDTCMSYEEVDTCMSYEEEDTRRIHGGYTSVCVIIVT
jgi:hypothetical protein